MRIVVVLPYLAHYRVPLFEALQARGHEVLVVSSRMPNSAGFGETSPTFEHVQIEWPELTRTLRARSRPDDRIVSVIHASNRHLYAAAARTPRKRWLWWGHSQNFAGGRGARIAGAAGRRILLRMGDGVIAYTPGEAMRWRALGAAPETVFTTMNTVEVSSLREQFLRERSAEPRLSATAIGRVYPEKRVDLTIDAALVARRTLSSLRLTIVGSGIEEGRLRQKYAGHEWISWCGLQEDQMALGSILAGTSVFVNAGLLGLNVIQPFACGIPVLTTRQRNHSPEIEYLLDGVNGRVAEPDAESLGAAIVACHEPAVLGAMSANALNFWQQNLRFDRFIDAFEAAL